MNKFDKFVNHLYNQTIEGELIWYKIRASQIHISISNRKYMIKLTQLTNTDSLLELSYKNLERDITGSVSIDLSQLTKLVKLKALSKNPYTKRMGDEEVDGLINQVMGNDTWMV